MVSRRLFQLALLAAAGATLCYVATLIVHQSIAVVSHEPMLPRWDLAAHLVSGWTDYWYLKTLQIHRLLWDVWQQSYWPPVPSLYQMPFYFVLGSDISSGNMSSVAAFVLTGIGGTALLYHQWPRAAILPVALFLMFLVTSPFYLAYASVAMTEMPAALVSMCVLVCYMRYEQTRTTTAARLFAISLTLLFFTKYNYFILLAAPLLMHEYLRQTAGASLSARFSQLWRWTAAFVTSPIGAGVTMYLIAVLAITFSGGFEFHLFGRRIVMHTVGNTGYPVLYLLLARVWYLNFRGRIDWARLFAIDPRVRPLLIWFVAPVVVWIASPFPNHMKDMANLVINRPLGEPSIGIGAVSYVHAMADAYFHTHWLLALAVAGFVIAALNYRRQSPLVQWLILAAPIEFAMVAVHQTRFVRFLLVTLLPLWIVVGSEAGRWASGSRVRAWIAGLLAPFVLAYGVLTAHDVVQTDLFRSVAFNNYVTSELLRASFASLRGAVSANDRIAVQGQSEELSPGLFNWQLGPPSGFMHFPAVVTPDSLNQLDEATRVVLVAPAPAALAPRDIAARYATHLGALQERGETGEFVFDREFAVDDLHVSFRLYRRVRWP